MPYCSHNDTLLFARVLVVIIPPGRVVNVEDGKDAALSEMAPDKTQTESIVFTIYTV